MGKCCDCSARSTIDAVLLSSLVKPRARIGAEYVDRADQAYLLGPLESIQSRQGVVPSLL